MALRKKLTNVGQWMIANDRKSKSSKLYGLVANSRGSTKINFRFIHSIQYTMIPYMKAIKQLDKVKFAAE